MLIPGDCLVWRTGWYAISNWLGQCGIREFVYVADRPTFMKRELVGFGVDR